MLTSAPRFSGVTVQRVTPPSKKPERWPFLSRIVQIGVLSNLPGWACSEFWAIYHGRLTVAYPRPLVPQVTWDQRSVGANLS